MTDTNNDKRIVLSLDAGGTNFVFSAIQGNKELMVPESDRIIKYDSMPRTGIRFSKLGASKATMLGAYAYALQQLDSM